MCVFFEEFLDCLLCYILILLIFHMYFVYDIDFT